MRYELNERNIDAASEQIIRFLTRENVDSKEATRIRLSAEEVLFKYLSEFGAGKNFEIHAAKRFKTLRIEISVSGESLNPLESDGDEELVLINSLLAGLGLAPVWRYKNGKNITTFTARKKKKTSQFLQLGIAIAAALILGFVCRFLPQNVSGFFTQQLVTPVFNTLMGLLSAISGPIIFLSVVWGICGIGDMTTFGKIGKKMIGRFMASSLLTGLLAIAACLPFYRISASGETSFVFSDLFQMILDIVPDNMFSPFVEGNSLQIIFIAILVGIAMLMLGNRIPFVTGMIEQLNMIMQHIMGMVGTCIPFFVFGSILNMTAGNNFAALAKSYKLILAMLIADLVLMFAYLMLVALPRKVSPVTLLKKLMPTFIIGLTTASSAAAFSTNTETCREKLGIDKKIVDIGIPLGQVIFMPGAILLCIAAAFGMAETYATAITPTWLITAFIISVVLAIAAPPVPGAQLTCYTILFMQLNIPAEAIAVMIAMNVILEFIATAVNLFCLQTELTLLSGSLGSLDLDVLRANTGNDA